MFIWCASYNFIGCLVLKHCNLIGMLISSLIVLDNTFDINVMVKHVLLGKTLLIVEKNKCTTFHKDT